MHLPCSLMNGENILQQQREKEDKVNPNSYKKDKYTHLGFFTRLLWKSLLPLACKWNIFSAAHIGLWRVWWATLASISGRMSTRTARHTPAFSRPSRGKTHQTLNDRSRKLPQTNKTLSHVGFFNHQSTTYTCLHPRETSTFTHMKIKRTNKNAHAFLLGYRLPRFLAIVCGSIAQLGQQKQFIYVLKENDYIA